MIMLGPESAVFALFVMLPWLAIRLLSRVPPRRAVAEALFAGYVLVLLAVVLLPLRPVAPDAIQYLWVSVNLVPARTVVEILRDFHEQVIRQLVGNVVLFAPLGFLLPVLSARCRRLRTAVAVSLATSIGIELIQLMMLLSMVSQRSVDVDDVILNLTGAVFGWFVWRGARALAPGFMTSPDVVTKSA